MFVWLRVDSTRDQRERKRDSLITKHSLVADVACFRKSFFSDEVNQITSVTLEFHVSINISIVNMADVHEETCLLWKSMT